MAGTGVPPTSPIFGVPRYSLGDSADYPSMTNSVTDVFDAEAAKRGSIVAADLSPSANVSKTQLAPLALVDGDVSATAAIAEGKLALASDGPPGTPTRRSLGVGAQQACAGNDPRLGGLVPVGAIMAYAGTGDPQGPQGTWLAADGRLIDRTVYTAFYAAVGHTYNGGIDPGANMVKIPDKRGRHSVGAINMGTTLGPNDNAHAQVSRGNAAGEVNHGLTNGEMPSHSHGGISAGMNQNQAHSHAISVSANDVGHAHGTGVPYSIGYTGGAGNWVSFWDQANAGGGTPTNSYPIPLSTYTATAAAAANISASGSAGATNTDHSHAIGADGGSGAHNNLAPYEADCYIVRVA